MTRPNSFLISYFIREELNSESGASMSDEYLVEVRVRSHSAGSLTDSWVAFVLLSGLFL